jgi:actin-related protein 8
MKNLVVTSDTILIVYFTRFHDYEDMLEDTWHMEFPRRSDISDGLYPSMNVGLPMWDSYPVFSARPKKEEKVGLAEAITSSILSTGRFAYISPTMSSK